MQSLCFATTRTSQRVLGVETRKSKLVCATGNKVIGEFRISSFEIPRSAICAVLASVPLAVCGYGQGISSGTVRGVVLDPSGAVVKGATVEIHNPVTQYARALQTDNQGTFEFTKVPYNPYHLALTASGFEIYQQDVEVRSAVPIDLKVTLKIGTATTSVTVQAEANDLLETTPTAHTDVGQQLIQSLPVQNQSTGFAELVTNAAPAVAADANGFYHPLGEHADTEIVLDNQPIPDQQAKIFSNQLALNTVQSFELVTGAPPAEFGDRTSLIINTTSRSGVGQKKPTGELSAQYGSFGSWAELFNIGWGRRPVGQFPRLELQRVQPLPGPAGTDQPPRQRQRADDFRSYRPHAQRPGHFAPESLRPAFVVPATERF
jgi:hypothetical protein